METKVVYCKLLEKESDTMDYTTYVFKVLEDNPVGNYIMCIRYPNWEHRQLEIGEIGYLKFIEVIAGIDKWFDGNKNIPYNYSNWQFIKFIQKSNVDDSNNIQID